MDNKVRSQNLDYPYLLHPSSSPYPTLFAKWQMPVREIDGILLQ